jgi:thiopurine S-methyltransferase
MDPDFWHRRWGKNEIGFHEGRPNALLTAHWPALGLAGGETVFVPLCGKAIDMVWLAERGHRVIGVDLSPIAIRDFFAEHGLVPEVREVAGFEVHTSGPYELWSGDLFAMPAERLAGVGAVYDRAALVALPDALQQRYAAALKTLLPRAAPILLVAFNYDQAQTAGPPFATPPERVTELFAVDYVLTLVERRPTLDDNPNLKKRGLTWLEESVLILRRR